VAASQRLLHVGLTAIKYKFTAQIHVQSA
jgi:hypothetical protein